MDVLLYSLGGPQWLYLKKPFTDLPIALKDIIQSQYFLLVQFAVINSS